MSDYLLGTDIIGMLASGVSTGSRPASMPAPRFGSTGSAGSTGPIVTRTPPAAKVPTGGWQAPSAPAQQAPPPADPSTGKFQVPPPAPAPAPAPTLAPAPAPAPAMPEPLPAPVSAPAPAPAPTDFGGGGSMPSGSDSSAFADVPDDGGIFMDAEGNEYYGDGTPVDGAGGRFAAEDEDFGDYAAAEGESQASEMTPDMMEEMLSQMMEQRSALRPQPVSRSPEMLGSYLHGCDVLGEDVVGAVDVGGLVKRFDELPHDNITAHQIWRLHGYPLAQSVGKAAQDLLNKAILPTNEFAFHDQVIAFAKRADAVTAKIDTTPYDEKPSPYWDDVRGFILDGASLVNTLEGVAAGSLKWGDVKAAVAAAAHGLGDAAKHAESTFKWTTGLLVGGAVLLGGALILGAYKVLSGPAGQAVGHGFGYAAGRRLAG